MRRLLAALLVPGAAALLAAAPAPAARADDYCCVNAGLTATYDAAAKTITARWQAAPAGVAPAELRAGIRLGADGVVDRSAPGTKRLAPKGPSGSFAAGTLAATLAAHGGVFVQVRFACTDPKALPVCRGGGFWSHPVQVTAAQAPSAKAPSALEIVQGRVRLTSNGTGICEAAIQELRRQVQEINANTEAARRAKAAGKSTVPFGRRQDALLAELTGLYKDGAKVCR